MKRKTATILIFLLVVCFAISNSRAESLMPGKTWAGTISADPYFTAQKCGLPVTQNVTMRIEKIQGNSAQIFLSWSETSKQTGKPGSGVFNAEVSQYEGLQKITSNIGKMKWTFIIQADGAVRCSLEVPDRMQTRSGYLH